MKVLEKNKAIELRKQGKTYTEIQQTIPISKSCLSYWLRDIKLNKKQLGRIYQKNLRIRRKFIDYNRIKRKDAIAKREKISQEAYREIRKISKRELKLIGTALYWAEGCKLSVRGGLVSFVNSDPAMVQLAMRWFREVCLVPESKLRARVQIHEAKRLRIVEKYWSRLTNIPLTQFTAPTLRVSKTSQGKRGNILPYGVVTVRTSNAKVFSKILGWIQGIGALSSSLV